MEIGKLIDQLYAARAKRIKLDQQSKLMKANETSIKTLLIAELQRLKLDAGAGKTASASLQRALVPQVITAETDWPLLYAYIKKHGTFEMLSKRLLPEPFRERYAQGETVPGVQMVSVLDIHLSARKAKGQK